MAKHKRSRAELESENEELRGQVSSLLEALNNALKIQQPLVKPDTFQFPWQQRGGGILPCPGPGDVYIGDPPPGSGPQIWCGSPAPTTISIQSFVTASSGPGLPEITEYFVGDPSEQHDQS